MFSKTVSLLNFCGTRIWETGSFGIGKWQKGNKRGLGNRLRLKAKGGGRETIDGKNRDLGKGKEGGNAKKSQRDQICQKMLRVWQRGEGNLGERETGCCIGKIKITTD